MSRAEEKRFRQACPTEAIVRDMMAKSEWARQILFGLKNLGAVVDPEGECATKAQKIRDQAKSAIEAFTPSLGKERRDFVKAERVKDTWASPSCFDGWMCPDSPTGACAYDNGDDDCCDHCGFPSERK